MVGYAQPGGSVGDGISLLGHLIDVELFGLSSVSYTHLAFFLISSLMTLVALAVAGQVDGWRLGVSLSFLPLVVAGHALGAALAPHIPRGLLQVASLGLCAMAALSLLVKGLS